MKYIISLFLLLSTNAFADHANLRLISVTGTAEKSFDPDMAKIHINLWGKADNAKAAQVLCQGQYDLLKKLLDSEHIAKSDVQTVGYELNPDYAFDNKTSTNKIVGFNASQTIRITLKKVELVGKFLDALNLEGKNLKAGTNVQSVNWDLEKRESIQKSLLAEAVDSAKTEADMLAQAAHVKIKGLQFLTPSYGNSEPQPMYGGGMMMKSARLMAAPPPTSLFAGEVKVTAMVAAQYEIE